MKFLILCSIIATTFAAPGGLLGYGGLGLGHGYGLGGISIAAAPVAVAAPAPVVVQSAPTIVKTIAPAATSFASFSQVHINHPAPAIAVAAHAVAPAISVAHPVAVAQPIIKYAAAPSIAISGFGGHGYALGGHGYSFH